jgi:uncharacterized protein YidB (DUF937 family)
MARGTPSMMALLGLLAVAGYQNKDKIREMLGGGPASPGDGSKADSSPGGLGGILGSLSGMMGGASAGNVVRGGVGELLKRFQQNGQSDTADSWVSKGPNKPISADALEQALGDDDISMLMEKTNLSREELLARLARTLPEAVDKYTPDGKLS